MENRLYPISEAFFKKKIEPLIFSNYKRPGRPPKTNHFTFFCGFLYVLRTGVSWKDLPPCFGPWHSVYTRFKRWSENGLFWLILCKLQQNKCLKVEVVWVDSTTVALHSRP